MLVHIVIGLIYIGLPLVSVAALAPEESTEFDGQSVTDFALQAPDGAMVGLRNFRGCPVIVGFFATWCPSSCAQLTQLAKLHDKYADQGLAIFVFAVDPFETPETTKDVGPLALKMRLPFPVGGATRELADGYHYKGFPTTIVLNGEGNIARTFLASTRWKNLSPVSNPCLTSRNDRVIRGHRRLDGKRSGFILRAACYHQRPGFLQAASQRKIRAV